MNPNVFLILLDSLRADTIFGNQKSCKTPNIDKLISNGTSFTNGFCTADHTGVSVLSILRSIFPITNYINPYKLNPNVETFTKIFKSNNFKTVCYFPDISFFKTLAKQFDNSIIYDYTNRDDYQKHKEKYFEKLIETINSQNQSKSLFSFIHLMDLKYPYVIPDKFDNENFGKNRQDRMLSYLDSMLGKIIKSINLENSVIIFSSDHGDYVPPTGKNLNEIPNIQKILRKIKFAFPSLEFLGIKLFSLLQNISEKYNGFKEKKNFSEFEQRGFLNRNDIFLFDDTFRVPIIFAGKNIPNLKISKLIRHIDLFPTICGLINLNFDERKYDGKNISKIFLNESINELDAYIESGPANEKLQGKSIGIRTPQFKYFRSRFDSKKDVHLYDIQKDENETKNISENQPEIVNLMENKLMKLSESNSEKNNLKRIINEKISKLKLD